MNIEEKDRNVLYGLRKSVIFYFYNSPNYKIIHELIQDYVDISTPEFEFYKYLTGDLKKIKGNWSDLIIKILSTSDYQNAVTCTMTEAKKDRLQNNLIQFSLSNYNPNYVLNLPNWIYFEFPNKVSWDEIYLFIRRACYSMTYFYISAGYSIGTNAHFYPKSIAESQKELMKFPFANTLTTNGNNLFFLKRLNIGIDGPNVIQVISQQLFEKVSSNDFKELCNEEKLFYELGEDYILINILGQFAQEDENIMMYDEEKILYTEIIERLKKLYDLLKPIVIKYEKPKMFWKDNEWDKWINRYEIEC